MSGLRSGSSTVESCACRSLLAGRAESLLRKSRKGGNEEFGMVPAFLSKPRLLQNQGAEQTPAFWIWKCQVRRSCSQSMLLHTSIRFKRQLTSESGLASRLSRCGSYWLKDFHSSEFLRCVRTLLESRARTCCCTPCIAPGLCSCGGGDACHLCASRHP